MVTVTAALAAGLLAGCGGHDDSIRPRRHFELSEGWTRVWSALDRRNPMPGSTVGASVTRTVVVHAPKDGEAVEIHLYCVNRTGQVDVVVDRAGGTGVPCSRRGTSGIVDLGAGRLVAPTGRLRFTITLPARARWSAAIDVGPDDTPSSDG